MFKLRSFDYLNTSGAHDDKQTLDVKVRGMLVLTDRNLWCQTTCLKQNDEIERKAPVDQQM